MADVFREALKDLSDVQVQFICDELQIDEAKLRAMSEDELDEIYDKMCDIEVDETMDCEGSELSERGRLAEGIVTLMGNALADEEEFPNEEDTEE